MALRVTETLPGERIIGRVQQRAVWDFVATVEDWRCVICFKRIEYFDRNIFDHTQLCPTCSSAVNESTGWLPAHQEADHA